MLSRLYQWLTKFPLTNNDLRVLRWLNDRAHGRVVHCSIVHADELEDIDVIEIGRSLQRRDLIVKGASWELTSKGQEVIGEM